MANCTKCGSVLAPGKQFCVACGARVVAAPQTIAVPVATTPLAAAPTSKSATAGSQFVRYIIKRLPLVILMFIGTTVLHTFLVYLNGGFDPGKTSEYTSYINVDENPGSSAFLIFSALAGLGWSFIYTIF